MTRQAPIEGVRELHGLSVPKIVVAEGDCGHVIVPFFLNDRHLTPGQARYLADCLYRVAGRLEAKPKPAAEPEPPTEQPGDDYLADKAEQLARELSEARDENREMRETLEHTRRQLNGYKGHSVRWGRGHLRERVAGGAGGEPEAGAVQ